MYPVPSTSTGATAATDDIPRALQAVPPDASLKATALGWLNTWESLDFITAKCVVENKARSRRGDTATSPMASMAAPMNEWALHLQRVTRDAIKLANDGQTASAEAVMENFPAIWHANQHLLASGNQRGEAGFVRMRTEFLESLLDGDYSQELAHDWTARDADPLIKALGPCSNPEQGMRLLADIHRLLKLPFGHTS